MTAETRPSVRCCTRIIITRTMSHNISIVIMYVKRTHTHTRPYPTARGQQLMSATLHARVTHWARSAVVTVFLTAVKSLSWAIIGRINKPPARGDLLHCVVCPVCFFALPKTDFVLLLCTYGDVDYDVETAPPNTRYNI